MDQRKDIMMNNYLGNPDLFADFFNVILFAGHEVLRPEELTDISTDHKEMVGGNDETAQNSGHFLHFSAPGEIR